MVFISKRELEAGKFPLGSQHNPQLLDPHCTIECGEQKAVKI